MGSISLRAQVDSFQHQGFQSYNDAADTLFARLMNKKIQPLIKFTVNEDDFVKETRKTDTVVPIQMIHGQYLAYWSKVERSYKRVYKKLRKSRVTSKKAVYDTTLLYRNSGSHDVVRLELYFYQKKYKAYVKFQLWQVNGLWYFTGKMDLVEEKVKPKK